MSVIRPRPLTCALMMSCIAEFRAAYCHCKWPLPRRKQVPMLKVASLREALLNSPSLGQATLWGITGQASLADVARRSLLSPNLSKFAGRSVVLAIREQFAAALALIELDGLAQRVTLCPRDLDVKQLSYVF